MAYFSPTMDTPMTCWEEIRRCQQHESPNQTIQHHWAEVFQKERIQWPRRNNTLSQRPCVHDQCEPRNNHGFRL